MDRPHNLFYFEIKLILGAQIRIANYLARHPVGEASRVKVYDKIFTVIKNGTFPHVSGYVKPKDAARRHNTAITNRMHDWANQRAVCKCKTKAKLQG